MKHTFLLIVVVVIGCRPTNPASKPPFSDFSYQSIDCNGLENVFALDHSVFTGSVPESDQAFESLRSLKIRTVVSVDGATPAVEQAQRFGMRYVHLPIGYDGISQDRIIAIAKAIRDCPGPIYLHCHHGKHRGPAAAAAALRCLHPDQTSERFIAFLRAAGTDSRYAGLYSAVESAPPVLDTTTMDFPSTSPVPDLVARMVDLDECWSGVKKKPTRANTALLVECYRELKRITHDRDERFQKLLENSLQSAIELEHAIRIGQDGSSALKRSAESCSACHALFRDNRISSPP